MIDSENNIKSLLCLNTACMFVCFCLFNVHFFWYLVMLTTHNIVSIGFCYSWPGWYEWCPSKGCRHRWLHWCSGWGLVALSLHPFVQSTAPVHPHLPSSSLFLPPSICRSTHVSVLPFLHLSAYFSSHPSILCSTSFPPSVVLPFNSASFFLNL